MEPFTQEIVKSGVVSDVILSVEDDPESVAAVISGVPGAASAIVSTVNELTLSTLLRLPAVSVTVIVQFE